MAPPVCLTPSWYIVAVRWAFCCTVSRESFNLSAAMRMSASSTYMMIDNENSVSVIADNTWMPCVWLSR